MSRRLLTASLIALLCAVGLTTAPANAAPAPAPQARIVYGDRTLTVTWNKTAGARYRVQYATNKTFGHAKTTGYTTNNTVTLKNLRNRQPYSVRILSYQQTRKTATSARYTVTPQAGYPMVMPTVKVTPGSAPDQIRVTWSKLQRATRVIVLAGSDNQQIGAPFHSAWLPATTTSTTLTVPEKYRWLIGSNTANPIYVKIAQYNNMSATKILKTRSDPAAYRLSLAGNYGYTKALSVTGSTPVRVATYNIQSVAASPADHPWVARKARVINNILASNADLIGLQEDDAAVSMNYQHRQVAVTLAPHGYAMSGDLPADYKYNSDLTDSWFYYKTSSLTRLDGGIVSPRDDLHINWPKGMTDTRGTWGKFQVKNSGQVFYALNIHLPASGSSVGLGASAITALRVAEIQALSAYIQARAGGQPVVLLGDLNAAVFRDGYTAPAKLHDLGWYDTASATQRINAAMQTANAPISYPTGKPYRAPNVTTGRIDYIFTRNMGGAKTYVNQVILDPAGNIDLTYQGSDHNLQLATLMF